MSGELANTGKILIYQNEKGDTKIDVYFEEDTIWMTQRSMAELYQVTPQNITHTLSTSMRKVNWNRGQLVRVTYKFRRKEIVKFAVIQNFIILK